MGLSEILTTFEFISRQYWAQYYTNILMAFLQGSHNVQPNSFFPIRSSLFIFHANAKLYFVRPKNVFKSASGRNNYPTPSLMH
jgi:hypothetical protein